jgi:hypothetical protein
MEPESFIPVIACVKWGERYGAYYVNTLYDMVHRNLPQGTAFAFQCFTDAPVGLHPSITPRALPGDLTGWWNKLYLFKEGVFSPDQRIIYFDLDTLITGRIEALLQYAGNFALLRDFYRPQGYGSGVMLWHAKTCHYIWSDYETAHRPMPAGGDQAWIEIAYKNADYLQDFFPGMFASFKTDCRPLPPEGTSVVCFHGEPKQDNCGAIWVRQIWKPDAPPPLEPVSYLTTQEEQLANMRDALTKPYPWIARLPAHNRPAILIGGGASLEDCIDELRNDMRWESTVFAINGASLWLRERGVTFDAHVMCTAENQHKTLIPTKGATCYYAAICSPAILQQAKEKLSLWHPAIKGAQKLLEKESRAPEWVEGELSTGLQAIRIAHLLGYRHFHLYGFDSCFQGQEHHAYAWLEEEHNRRYITRVYGREFRASTWMLRQAQEFVRLADGLLKEGCFFTIHGDGLLHFLATHAQQDNG